MKELSIEEKAKTYDEALKKANDMLSYKEVKREDMEYLFPELKESEDERIVKELLTFFRESMHGGHILTNKEYDSWLAWLEKQGKNDILEDAIVDSNDDGLIADIIKAKGEQKPKVGGWLDFNISIDESLVDEQVTTFCNITKEMCELYAKKNHDYGNSFDEGCDKIGVGYPTGRLLDKLNRLIACMGKEDEMQVNESIEDTLKDLACYSVMTLSYLRRKKNN